jgi:hypothetical protein
MNCMAVAVDFEPLDPVSKFNCGGDKHRRAELPETDSKPFSSALTKSSWGKKNEL